MERSKKQEHNLRDAVERMIPITAHPQFGANLVWQPVRTRSHADTDAGDSDPVSVQRTGVTPVMYSRALARSAATTSA